MRSQYRLIDIRRIVIEAPENIEIIIGEGIIDLYLVILNVSLKLFV
jgi:hypothetical protein